MCDKLYGESASVASATECTGVVPAMSVDDPHAERDMTQLYHVLPPKKRKTKGK